MGIFSKEFPYFWIRTADLWCRKRPLNPPTALLPRHWLCNLVCRLHEYGLISGLRWRLFFVLMVFPRSSTSFKTQIPQLAWPSSPAKETNSPLSLKGSEPYLGLAHHNSFSIKAAVAWAAAAAKKRQHLVSQKNLFFRFPKHERGKTKTRISSVL